MMVLSTLALLEAAGPEKRKVTTCHDTHEKKAARLTSGFYQL